MSDEEKAVRIEPEVASSAPPSPPTSSPPSHHIHHQGHLHKIFHPSGKVFHIVNTHYDIEPKRRDILEQDPKSTDFDVLVHGSEEHVNVVRDCHRQQTKSRDALYASNEGVLSHYENVRTELDALSKELHSLTDHAVSLEASFDKWGYSARLRTHGESETSSLNSDSTHDVSRHDDRTLTAMKFFKAPVVRQYYHKGLIWRSPQASEVVSFELFVDLVYVAVIDALGEVAALHASGESFLHYIIVFSISSKVFGDIVTITNWFEINDIFGRLCILFILVCLYAFASNTEYLFEITYTAGLSFYLASRFFVALWLCLVAWVTPMIRPTLLYHASVAVFAIVIWIASIHVAYPANLGLIFVAIFIDLFGSTFLLPSIRFAAARNKTSKFWQSLVDYLPAVNIEHRVERTGAFISLVIGYSVIRIFFQSHVASPTNAFLGKGILGLVQAFIFNWIYFEIDAGNLHVHAIRRHWISTGIWNTTHIFFSGAFILAASTLAELVIAHDCSDAELDMLASAYASTSLGEIDSALRWFYCGGLGVALICMVIISLTHVHKKNPNAKLGKRARLSYRVLVAIAIICLPLAGQRLSSLDLITITTCLVASVLMLEVGGLSCSGDGFFKGAFCPERKRKTQYTARCRLSEKKRLKMADAVRRGEKMDLDEVLARDDSVTSFSSDETRVNGVDRAAGTY